MNSDVIAGCEPETRVVSCKTSTGATHHHASNGPIGNHQLCGHQHRIWTKAFECAQRTWPERGQQ